MTEIESDQKTISRSPSSVFRFLSDFENFKLLLPEDKIEKWQSTGESCSFRVKGLTDLGLKFGPCVSGEKITLVSDGKVPFPFEMKIAISAFGEGSSNVRIYFSGDINPVMKMFIEKPLTNFLNMIIADLAEREIE